MIIDNWLGIVLIFLYGLAVMNQFYEAGKGNYNRPQKAWLKFADGTIDLAIFLLLLMSWD